MGNDGEQAQPIELEPRLRALRHRLHSLLGGGYDNTQPEDASDDAEDTGLISGEGVDLMERELGAA